MPRPPADKGGRGRLTPLAGVLLALALATGATTRTAGAEELKPYKASYEGIWHGMVVAVSHLMLERTGDTWTFSSASEPRGIGRLASGIFPPREVSVVRATAAGVLPQSFKSAGGDSTKGTDLAYDWQARRVSGTYEGAQIDQPLTGAVQDDASVQLALMVELLAGRTPRSFRMIDRNGTREYQFARDGETTLHTPMGEVATVIYRAQKANSPRITRFWCAPQQGYVPMKVEQTRGDEVQWTMEIRSLSRE